MGRGRRDGAMASTSLHGCSPPLSTHGAYGSGMPFHYPKTVVFLRPKKIRTTILKMCTTNFVHLVPRLLCTNKMDEQILSKVRMT